MITDVKKIIAEMTLEEKSSLCSGLNFWSTQPLERLGIPSIMMTDGPHGLRKPPGGDGEQVGIGNSEPSTCFPSGSALAASWDVELLEKVGVAIGEAAQAAGVQIVLGPAMNIKRSPLCGRNFEYFSEDPYLTSEMAASYIRGVQSQGVGTSPKHYAVNNQEHRRMSVNAVVDERSMREIYLTGFEGAVKQSKPWTIMAAYNKVNGIYATEHPYLLTEILRNEWGFDGFVVSDWMAVNERVAALAAGLDLEMPGNGGYGDRKIAEAVRTGKLSVEQLDKVIESFLNIVFKAHEARKENATIELENHHQLARTAAAESMVLLKNEDGILPIKKIDRVAVIGEMAKKPRYQGSGSSYIVPTQIDIPWDELVSVSEGRIEWSYAQGYELESDEWHESLVEEAVSVSKQADCTILFVGLPDRYESEGYDRTHLQLPDNHKRLIEAIAADQSNLIIVLSNGSPVEMPWIDRVKAVLEANLGGQAAGGAIADLLLGKANPCGKLAESFPMELRHNPSYFNFPGEDDEVFYREGVFVGYRYYDTKGIKPLFSFGHGLSYTTFEYTDISLDRDSISDEEMVRVTVKVKNTGEMAGKEIVQIYIRDVESSVSRPEKELKGFRKVYLEPGEEKHVEFFLDKRAFAYYNTTLKDWHIESGEFEVLAGTASDRIMLRKLLNVSSTVKVPNIFTRNSTLGDLMGDEAGAKIVNLLMRSLGQRARNISEEDQSDNSEHGSHQRMMSEVAKNMPLRSIIARSNGSFTDEQLEQLLKQDATNKEVKQ